MENVKLIEKALKILNTNFSHKIMPAEIRALKGMSLETGLNYILANAQEIMDFDTEQVDWSKVLVDTPIYVAENINDCMDTAHFAFYKNNTVYAYTNGRTSHTASLAQVTPWKHAELAHPQDFHNPHQLDDLLDELEDCLESTRDDVREKIHRLFEGGYNG